MDTYILITKARFISIDGGVYDNFGVAVCTDRYDGPATG